MFRLSRILLYYTILGVFGHTATSAQTGYYFQRSYDVNDGLPQNGVSGIAKDHNGFLWFSTDGGIVRWDGRNFKRTEFPETRVIGSAFKRDYLGNLYIVGTENIYMVDSTSNLQKLTHRNDSTLFFTFSGDIVRNTLGREQVKRKHPDLSTVFPSPDRTVRQVAADFEGSYYLIKEDTVAYITPNYAKLLWSGKDVGPMLVLTNCLVYLSRKGAYEVYSGGDLIKSGELKEIAEAKHRSFLGSENNVDPETAVVRFDNILYDIALDSNHSLMIKARFQIPKTMAIRAFFFDSENHLAVLGGTNSGFKVFKRQGIWQEKLFNETEENNIYALLPLGTGRIISDRHVCERINDYKKVPWVHSFAGPLLRLSPDSILYANEGNIFLLDEKLNLMNRWHVDVRIRELVRIGDIVFFSPETLGALHLTTGVIETPVSANLPFSPANVRAIAPSFREGCLYAAVGRDLYEINIKKNTTRLVLKDALSSLTHLRVKLYPDTHRNLLFIVDENNRLSAMWPDGRLSQLPLDPQHALLRCNHLLVDADGDYWLSSNNGLFLLPGTELQQFLTQQKDQLTYRKFGIYDGMVNEEFNGGFTGSGMVKGDSIFFASAMGLVRFDTSIKNKTRKTSRKTILDRVILDDSIQPRKQAYHLPPNFRLFEVQVARPFIYEHNGQLVYTIHGTNDSTWLGVPADGKLVIRNMPAGEYVLKIGLKDEETAEHLAIPFIVNQYWYKHHLTVVTGLLLLIVVVSIGYMARIRFLQQKILTETLTSRERLRSLRQQINPHFLQNIFSFIGHNVEKGISGNELANYVKKMASFYQEVLASTDKLTVRLEDELDFLDKYLSIQRDISSVPFDYRIHVSDSIDTFGTELPGLLLQPIVENALKHAFTPESINPFIEISVFSEDDDHVICSFKDNGVGYSATAHKAHSYGNKITVERLNLAYRNYTIAPQYEVRSKEGKGTEVLVKLPTY